MKLIPGMRLNLSKSGISVSGGVRGARGSLTKRGTYATFGIPGTGMYWTEKIGGKGRSTQTTSRRSVPSKMEFRSIESLEEFDTADSDPNQQLFYADSGRRLSQQQVEANRRRMLEERTRQAANAEIQAWKERQRDIVHCWREMIYFVPLEVYSDAVKTRPFSYRKQLPVPPDERRERRKLASEIRSQHLQKHPIPVILQVSVVVLSLVVGLLSFMATESSLGIAAWALSSLFVAVSAIGGYFGLRKWWSLEFEKSVRSQANALWSERLSQVRKQHERDCKEFENEKELARREWEKEEAERTAWARRLIEGNVEAIEDAICDSLADLDFPFETDCTVAVSTSDEAFLHLDLPEIEDVISDKSYSVLKDGTIKEKKRSQSQRFGDYADLVAGLSILMGATAFAAAPTVKNVSIACYTQRKKKGETVDDYILAVSFSRMALVELGDPKTFEPIQFLASNGATLSQNKNHKLKSITPPSWVSELESA